MDTPKSVPWRCPTSGHAGDTLDGVGCGILCYKYTARRVVEKLADIVTLLHQEISEAFEDNGLAWVGTERDNKLERLGVASLALHYANLINQIDNIISKMPTTIGDALTLTWTKFIKVKVGI
ncbi:hypothetical protein HYC85_014032 [Camellia sinensis]|uniref:DUF668 domain-containing protein n=1 Tax=Camellia sinensis TaxID=4442 RepID=A0A7J7H6E1_CAMSI|nr:hypothetical protein HYC85_014032 [Camellia sinensis]